MISGFLFGFGFSLGIFVGFSVASLCAAYFFPE